MIYYWGCNTKPDSRGTYTQTVYKGRWQPGAQKERGTLGRLGLTCCQHHALMLHILSCQRAKRCWAWCFDSCLALRCKDTDVQEHSPKLSLIRGDRTALQLMGGYWKLAPTDARGVRAVLTRAGGANSGPGPTGREDIPKSKSESGILTFKVKMGFKVRKEMIRLNRSTNLSFLPLWWSQWWIWWHFSLRGNWSPGELRGWQEKRRIAPNGSTFRRQTRTIMCSTLSLWAAVPTCRVTMTGGHVGQMQMTHQTGTVGLQTNGSWECYDLQKTAKTTQCTYSAKDCTM